ncbi:hypothetical protein K445DRAFT_315618 [Daldinia sp. EC12]|nr:hypothetical protein K445DRAFT_315618 [Daldinia sp. EC12]
MRKRMWEKVAARKHLLLRVYPVMFYPETSYGGDESRRPAAEYMIEGKVLTIGWHNFESRETSWAAHAILVEEQGELKYRFYQVCLSEHGRHGLDVSVGDRLRVFARRWLGPVLLVAALDVLYHKFLA